MQKVGLNAAVNKIQTQSIWKRLWFEECLVNLGHTTFPGLLELFTSILSNDCEGILLGLQAHFLATVFG